MKLFNPISFVIASGKAIYATFTGHNVLADQKTVDKRLSLCETCRFFNRDDRQCTVCTCLVDLKVQLKTESCPKGYWRRVRLTKGALLRLVLKTWHYLQSRAT